MKKTFQIATIALIALYAVNCAAMKKAAAKATHSEAAENFLDNTEELVYALTKSGQDAEAFMKKHKDAKRFEEADQKQAKKIDKGLDKLVALLGDKKAAPGKLADEGKRIFADSEGLLKDPKAALKAKEIQEAIGELKKIIDKKDNVIENAKECNKIKADWEKFLKDKNVFAKDDKKDDKKGDKKDDKKDDRKDGKKG